ncbi:MAG: response regulator transcription factor [Bacilli bacterium]|nr:response regulator transcription factor [Bacilli bacterium]
MRIAICDDNKMDLQYVTIVVEEFFNKKNITPKIDKFVNPRLLLNKLTEDENLLYDLFILDVVMPQNGIIVAQKINKLFPNAVIIFQSTSRDFAADAFRVRALDYFLKPINKIQVFETLERLYDSIAPSNKTVIQIKDSEFFLTSIVIQDINYIESFNRRLLFHLIDGRTIYSTTLRSKFIDSMPFDLETNNFIACHASFVVNLNQVKSISSNSFVMFNGKVIPISKKLYKNIKNQYITYLVGDNNE